MDIFKSPVLKSLMYIRLWCLCPKPNSLYNFSQENPSMALVIANPALYLTDSILLERDSFSKVDCR